MRGPTKIDKGRKIRSAIFPYERTVSGLGSNLGFDASIIAAKLDDGSWPKRLDTGDKLGASNSIIFKIDGVPIGSATLLALEAGWVSLRAKDGTTPLATRSSIITIDLGLGAPNTASRTLDRADVHGLMIVFTGLRTFDDIDNHPAVLQYDKKAREA